MWACQQTLVVPRIISASRWSNILEILSKWKGVGQMLAAQCTLQITNRDNAAILRCCNTERSRTEPLSKHTEQLYQVAWASIELSSCRQWDVYLPVHRLVRSQIIALSWSKLSSNKQYNSCRRKKLLLVQQCTKVSSEICLPMCPFCHPESYLLVWN